MAQLFPRPNEPMGLHNLVNSRTLSDVNRQVMDGTISLINGDSASLEIHFERKLHLH